MIVILKPNVAHEKREQLIEWLKAQSLGVRIMDEAEFLAAIENGEMRKS